MKVDFKPAINLINKSEKIGLITHKNGDGDAFGSTLAMRDALLELGKEVVIFSNEDLPKHLGYMKSFSFYNHVNKYIDVDLLIILDANTEHRLTCPEVFSEVKSKKVPTMLIDHHEANGLNNNVDVAISTVRSSSACELVYWLVGELKIKITKEIAEYIFIGIETDTNFLNNPNTYSSTLEARANLLNCGINMEEIHKGLEENSFLGNSDFIEVIEKRISDNNGVITTYILFEDYDQYGVEIGASSPIASYLDQKYDAKFILVAEQRGKNNVKVSMRSNKSMLDVARLASFFGGGGHKQAAGFEYEGNISDLLQ